MSRITVALSVMALLAGSVSAETGFLDRTLSIAGQEYRYQVYVPLGWSADRSWPTVLFLHGAGERGDDGLLPTEVGIGSAIRRNAARFPCVVVFPECRKDLWWTVPAMQDQAMAALDTSVKEFHGDPARLYLTGLSMGGYGTWGLAARFPGKFAALAPICGGITVPPQIKKLAEQVPDLDSSADPFPVVARKIGKTPVWIFHGDADTVVPPDESRKMEAALKAAGGNVQYTEYPGVGHNAWDKAYGDALFVEWLLSQRLTQTAK